MFQRKPYKRAGISAAFTVPDPRVRLADTYPPPQEIANERCPRADRREK
jgi:hypothetical protein